MQDNVRQPMLGTRYTFDTDHRTAKRMPTRCSMAEDTHKATLEGREGSPPGKLLSTDLRRGDQARRPRES